VSEHLENILEDNIEDILMFTYTGVVVTVFLYELKDACPVNLLKFWDIFMLKGDKAILCLIVNCFELYQSDILDMDEDKLIGFLKKDMVVRIFEENEGPGAALGI